MGKLLPDIALTAWPLINLVVFLIFFTGLVLWVFRPNAKATYKKYGALPLDKKENSHE